MLSLHRLLPHAVLVLALAACSPGPGDAGGAAGPRAAAPDPAALESLRPADPALAAQYERACFLCHARAGSGAPPIGDAAAWAPRLAQGEAALVAHVRQGLGGMPPMGLCPDCGDAQLAALVRFVTTGAPAASPAASPASAGSATPPASTTPAPPGAAPAKESSK